MTTPPTADPRVALRAARTLFPAAGLEDLADALDFMAETLGDSMTAMHVGPRFSCTEANSIADVLHAAGHGAAAETWLDGHAEASEDRSGDADPEDHHHGRHIRGRVLDRYNGLLIAAARAERLTNDEFRKKWDAAHARLADVDRYADGRDHTARYELPGAELAA